MVKLEEKDWMRPDSEASSHPQTRRVLLPNLPSMHRVSGTRDVKVNFKSYALT